METLYKGIILRGRNMPGRIRCAMFVLVTYFIHRDDGIIILHLFVRNI